MPGASVTFTPDRPISRAGVNVAIQNIGDISNPVALGVVGAVFSANWGPFTVTKLYGGQDVDRFYGVTGNVDTAKQAFYGGAGTILATRLNGTGSTQATGNLIDTTTIASPTTAPTLTPSATGGTIAAGTYTVGYTFVNANGETTLSTTATTTVPAGTTGSIAVSALPALSAGATGMYLYISQVGTTTPMYRVAATTPTSPLTGTAATITAIPPTTATVAPTTNTATTPVTTGTIRARYSGTRGNGISLQIRNSLSGVGKEALVLEGTRVWESFLFSSTGDQTTNLSNSVAASGSDFITVTVGGTPGNGVLANTTITLAGGTNPTSTVADYTTALGLLEAYDQNITVTDSEDPTMLATFQGWVDRVRSEGIRTLFVFSEPTSIPFGNATTVGSRMYNANSLNDFAMIYVANGFVDLAGNNIHGHSAAGRIAGMIAGSRVTDSLTHTVVFQAVNVLHDTSTSTTKNAASFNDIMESYNDGALIFTTNSRGQVQVEYGQTTFRIANTQYDAGWKKIRRVRTRDNLINRVVALWEPLIGRVNNTDDGRSTLQAKAQTVINQMVNEGALVSGTVAVSTRYPPAGDTVIFEANVDDADSAEKIGVIFGFRFSIPAPPVR